MMPDLGKYAAEVTSAYGLSFVLLALLVWFSWRRAVRVRSNLAQVEARVKGRAPGTATDKAQPRGRAADETQPRGRAADEPQPCGAAPDEASNG